MLPAHTISSIYPEYHATDMESSALCSKKGSGVESLEPSFEASGNCAESYMQTCLLRAPPSQLMLQARLSTPEPMTAVTMFA